MDGPETQKALRDLDLARETEHRKRMKLYDEEVYRPNVKALKDQCPHEPMDYWFRNGVGWSASGVDANFNHDQPS